MNQFRSPVIAVSILKQWYQKKYVVPLVRQYPLEHDPWIFAKHVSDRSNVFFLDSGSVKGQNARYSYLGWDPFLIFRQKKLNNFIPKLREIFSRFRGRKWKEAPFFTGGAVGYFSYEVARVFEDLPDYAGDDTRMNPVTLFFIRDFIVFDCEMRRYFIISNLVPDEDRTFRQALEKSKERIVRLEAVMKAERFHSPGPVRVSGFQPDMRKRDFKRMVHRAKQYIKAGDIYQANLSQRFSFRCDGEPATIYDILRGINPSPFSSFMKISGLTILSVSPERLIRKNGEFCETRPIAGTRPRGRDPVEDEKFRNELRENRKELAEHIMLVDLERNDLGRVCRPHSVRVSEMMALEKYSHVTHIVSNVIGRLQKDYDQFDLLRAMFPGGTITGCPKIRSMEIIEELEPFKRNLYTGSLGWIGFDGDMDLNIVIRTIILKGTKGYLQVGAGIVHDSDPEQEYLETLHKAKALLDAIEVAGKGQMKSTQGNQLTPFFQDLFVDGKRVECHQIISASFEPEHICVFESMKSYEGKIFRLAEHLDRMFASAKTVGLRLPKTKYEMAREIKTCSAGFKTGNHLLRFSADDKHSYLVVTSRQRSPSIYREGVSLKTTCVSRNHVNAEPPAAKTGSFFNGVFALAGAADYAFDRILLGENGYLAEGTIWNLFLIKNGVIYTPGTGILNGVTRRFVVECARKEKFQVEETFLTRHDFWNADEAFITNTSGEIVPVRSLDGRMVGGKIPGTLTLKLTKRFHRERIKELKQL